MVSNQCNTLYIDTKHLGQQHTKRVCWSDACALAGGAKGGDRLGSVIFGGQWRVNQFSDGHVPDTIKECSTRAIEWYLVGICTSIAACWAGDCVFRR